MHRLVHNSDDILSASEGTLSYFASYLARSVHHCAIKLYLAAVRNLHISCGHSDPLVGELLLKKVLRSILHYEGQQFKGDRLQIIVASSEFHNCSSVGCLKCVQFHNWFRLR